MTASTVWISYDLGVRGDYEGLYAWLDSHKAKECGDSVAVLTYRSKRELADEIRADLKKNVTIDKNSRIYLIYRDHESEKNRGKFLFGGRRASPWTGYSVSDAELVDEES